MDQQDSKELRKTIFQIIENQIKDGTPPETKQTFDRLIAEGFSKLETMKLIGFALLAELSDMVREGRIFDEAAYVKMLEELPSLSLEE